MMNESIHNVTHILVSKRFKNTERVSLPNPQGDFVLMIFENKIRRWPLL